MRTLYSLGIVATLLATTACSSQTAIQPIEDPTLQPPAVIESSSSSSVESVPEIIPMKEVVLVDQDYTGVANLKGADWLRAVKAARVEGLITDGELVVTLSRGEDNTSWSAAGMYLANVFTSEAGNKWPAEEQYGTRLHFLDAEWRGDCQRHLAPSSSFGVLKEHDATLTMKLRDVRMTKGDDGCATGQDSVDILEKINNDGVYLGFAPSDRRTAPYMKVVLRYRGEVTVTPF